eukprot:s5402_g4.t1
MRVRNQLFLHGKIVWAMPGSSSSCGSFLGPGPLHHGRLLVDRILAVAAHLRSFDDGGQVCIRVYERKIGQGQGVPRTT